MLTRNKGEPKPKRSFMIFPLVQSCKSWCYDKIRRHDKKPDKQQSKCPANLVCIQLTNQYEQGGGIRWGMDTKGSQWERKQRIAGPACYKRGLTTSTLTNITDRKMQQQWPSGANTTTDTSHHKLQTQPQMTPASKAARTNNREESGQKRKEEHQTCSSTRFRCVHKTLLVGVFMWPYSTHIFFQIQNTQSRQILIQARAR